MRAFPGAPSSRSIAADAVRMCNPPAITTSQQVIRQLARAVRDVAGSLPPLPRIFPDYADRRTGAPRSPASLHGCVASGTIACSVLYKPPKGRHGKDTWSLCEHRGVRPRKIGATSADPAGMPVPMLGMRQRAKTACATRPWPVQISSNIWGGGAALSNGRRTVCFAQRSKTKNNRGSGRHSRIARRADFKTVRIGSLLTGTVGSPQAF